MLKQALIQQYFIYLEYERRLSRHTLDAYRRDLNGFIKYCQQQNIECLNNASLSDIRQFIALEHSDKQLSAKSLNRKLSTIRSFYQYLVKEKEISHNPATGLKAPNSTRKLPNPIDVDQIQKLFEIRTNNPIHKRDLAIMELFYSSGLRLSELVGLDLKSLDLTALSVRVLGKGAKVRDLPVGRDAAIALLNWLNIRDNIPGALTSEAVFISRLGQRMHPRTVQKRLEFWGRKLGFPQGLHPHKLRHSFASHLLESSGNLRAVQKLLGHADISTTQIYTHLNFQHLAEVYDKTHPRARKRARKKNTPDFANNEADKALKTRKKT